MFCRKPRLKLPDNSVAAFIHQLTESELQAMKPLNDIKHNGAVLDIKIQKKEDTLMVEKLKAYRAELEAKKAEVVNSVINVEDDVAEYRAKVTAEAEARKAAAIAKIENDINCIDGIIAREEELAAAETVVVVAAE